MRSTFEQVVETIALKIRDRQIVVERGSEALARHAAPRRAVFVQRGGTLQLPDRGPYALAGDPKHIIEPLYFNAMRVDVFCFGESEGASESVWTDVLLAVRDVFGTDAVPTEWSAPFEELRGASADPAQNLLVQAFEWKLVVARDRGPGGVGSTIILLGFDTVYMLEDEPDD